jgi:hypothetical protein
MDNTNLKTLLLVVTFGLLFVSIGWVAPAVYATYAPQEQFVEVHGFDASNATTADDSHVICLDRTVYQPTPTTIFTELYIVDNAGATYEVDSRENDEYLEQGKDTVRVPYALPPEIEADEYRYRLVLQMELARGRVTRSFVFNSDKFTITESDKKSEQSYINYNC